MKNISDFTMCQRLLFKSIFCKLHRDKNVLCINCISLFFNIITEFPHFPCIYFYLCSCDEITIYLNTAAHTKALPCCYAFAV